MNVHNPNDETASFFKKLALSYPTVEQKQGKILPIGIDRLEYDGALKADCDDLRKRLFDGALPGGNIEGYLVVQSPRSLDVDAVYSAAQIDEKNRVTDLITVDIEEVPERIRRSRAEALPDLIVTPDIAADLVCNHEGAGAS